MLLARSTVIPAVILFTAHPVAGHHSPIAFNEGTVREVHWMNPHSWIYLDVVDTDGQSRAWALEGASVTTLRRDGWTQDSVQIGQSLSLRCHPLKDGSRGCLLGYITMPDGSEKEFD